MESQHEAGAGMTDNLGNDNLGNKIFSNQILILLGQVVELKVEVGLLRGLPLKLAVDCAFEFLESSLLLSELFDAEHLEVLKTEYQDFFERRAEPSRA
jgi:hypothetical protein